MFNILKMSILFWALQVPSPNCASCIVYVKNHFYFGLSVVFLEKFDDYLNRTAATMAEDKSKKNKSALNVQKGVEQPESLNKNAAHRFMQKRRMIKSAEELADEIKQGNITALSTGITLMESALETHREKADEIINLCVPEAGNALRIGFTGVPGVGKSTFIETFGMHLIAEGNKVAVLAVDPSGQRSGGSILGDKTRMQKLSVSDRAFIRPSPSAGTEGGVSRKTAESALLCEAAGFNYIFIETVGVGQSETAVHSMTDFFLLLMLAGAGDELQGIKRGIMEMADALVINKAEGNNIRPAQQAKREYENALHLFPAPESGRTVKVFTASALTGEGIPEIAAELDDYFRHTKAGGYFYRKRKRQAKDRMHETIKEALLNRFFKNEAVKQSIDKFEEKVIKGQISPYLAARKLLNNY